MPTSCAALDPEVGDVPVQPCLEPRGEPGGDVGREHRCGEEHVLGAGGGDDGLERVDARLRQRSGERGVVDDVDGRGAECAGGGRDVRDAVPDDDAGDVIAQRQSACEHAERALLDRAVVMLEEDEGRHRSFLAASQSTSCSAAEPSSSILT